MPTEIRFLQNLERDLTKVAEADKLRSRADVRARRRNRWRGWATAAAMLLGVAFVIGVVQTWGQQASNQFSTVGSAVNGAGGGTGYVVGGRTTTDEGLGTTPVPAAQPAPSATPAEAPGSGEAKTDLTKIVRDGAISLSIDRGQFPDVAAKVVAVARHNGGSMLSSTTSNGNSGTFTLRIPAANFDKAMVELAALGAVDSSEIQGKDVTADYLDAKAHLKIYLARRKFLFGLMAKATTTAESISVQRELEQVQLQIDQITGQLRYLNNQVAISTIKVDVHEPGAAPTDEQPSDIQNPSLGRAFARGVQGLLSVIGAILIGLGWLIPLLVLGAIGYGVFRLVRRRRPSDTA
jgi:hypothetical protein